MTLDVLHDEHYYLHLVIKATYNYGFSDFQDHYYNRYYELLALEFHRRGQRLERCKFCQIYLEAS